MRTVYLQRPSLYVETGNGSGQSLTSFALELAPFSSSTPTAEISPAGPCPDYFCIRRRLVCLVCVCDSRDMLIRPERQVADK